MGIPEYWWIGLTLVFPLLAVLLVIGAVRTRRRRWEGHEDTSGGSHLGVAPTTSSRVLGGDRIVVYAAPNQTQAALVAGALAGDGLEATVRLTGAAGYGAREYSVLVPLADRERAEGLLRDLGEEA